jgi:hypothetical protein
MRESESDSTVLLSTDPDRTTPTTATQHPAPSTPAAPLDRMHAAYIIISICGAGFLVPWNNTLSALDFYITTCAPHEPSFI